MTGNPFSLAMFLHNITQAKITNTSTRSNSIQYASLQIHYIYIGQQLDTYYSILPQYDVDEYTFHVGNYKDEVCCIITRNKGMSDNYNNRNYNSSTMNLSVTNESSKSDKDNAIKNTSIVTIMEIENVTTSTTCETLAGNENNQDLTVNEKNQELTENEDNQDLLSTTIQNDVSHHVSSKINTLTVRNDSNQDTLVTGIITNTIENQDSALSVTNPTEKESVTNADASDKVGETVIETVQNQHVTLSIMNPADKQHETDPDADDKHNEVQDHVSNKIDTLIVNENALATTTVTKTNENQDLDPSAINPVDKQCETNQNADGNQLSNGNDNNATANQESNENMILHVNDILAEIQENNTDE